MKRWILALALVLGGNSASAAGAYGTCVTAMKIENQAIACNVFLTGFAGIEPMVDKGVYYGTEPGSDCACVSPFGWVIGILDPTQEMYDTWYAKYMSK